MDAASLQMWQPDGLTTTLFAASGGLANGNGLRAGISDDSAHQAASSGHSGSDNGRDSDELLKTSSGGDKTADKTSKLNTANSKNRAAQRRYRERQKGKMETYKSQVEELSQRLLQLQTENESLENRNRLLEKVVQMKDERQTAAEAAPTPDVPEPGPNNMWMTTNTFVAVADFINSIRKNREPLVTPQEAAKVSPDDLKSLKADYVRELASLLLQHGQDQKSEGFKELEDYVLGHRLAAVNLLGSMSVKSFAQVLATKVRQSVAPAVCNKKYMDVLQLTPDQKRAFITARKGLLERTEQIKEKRREIVKDLEMAVPNLAPLMCGQQVAMLQACEASDAFKASLEAEHHSMVKFHIECGQVLSPLQEAHSLLEAHPANPDPWLITGYLEAEETGTLEAWLQSHGVSPQPGMFGPPPIASVSSAQAYGDGDRGLIYINGSSAGAPATQPLDLEPLPVSREEFNIPQQLGNGVLDSFGQGLETFGEDDMWLDLFPGLGTVKPA